VRYRSVQLLRALAAVMVLMLHAARFSLGGAGVDLFFILSGFIIATLAPRETWPRFLAKRAWLCQLPYMIHAAITAQLSTKLAFTSITLISIGSVSVPTLFPGWTLIFEIYFYVVAACASRCAITSPQLSRS